MSTTILGYNVSAPLMLAPTAMHQLAHPEGMKSHPSVEAVDGVLPSLTAALSSYQEKLPLQKQLPLLKSSWCYSGFWYVSYTKPFTNAKLDPSPGSFVHVDLHGGRGSIQL